MRTNALDPPKPVELKDVVQGKRGPKGTVPCDRCGNFVGVFARIRDTQEIVCLPCEKGSKANA